MIKDGWVVVAPGVLQRSQGDHKVETLALGPEGFAWTADQLQVRLELLLDEYRVRPTADLKKTIRSLRRQIRRLREQSQILASEPADQAKAGCNETYTAQASAYPTTPDPGVRADADASFSNACGYIGRTYAYAYAKATLNGSITTLTQVDEDPGANVSSHATASLPGTSDCEGFAFASVENSNLGINYSVSDETRACQPPAARFSFTCALLTCSFDASASTSDPFASYAWTFGDSTSGSGKTVSHTFPATGPYTVTLTVTNYDYDDETSSVSRKVSVTSEPPVPAESYFTVAPCRLADTRNSAPLSSGQLYAFNVAGACGIPATAKAVSFNVTILSPTGAGHLVFLPGNQTSGPFPHTTVNFDPANSPRANNAILRLATNGAGSVNVRPFVAASPGQVHVILDVYGYFSEDTAPAPGAQGPFGFQTVFPCRIADTRSSTPIAVYTTRDFTVQGACGVPAGAAAAALNLAVLSPTAGGHAPLFQAGAFPSVPVINFNAGVVLANGARIRLAATTPDVSLNYYSPIAGSSTHALLDVYGYFKPDAPLKYRPITACRAVDTRFADQGGPALGAPESRNFQIRGNCGVPLSAKAAAVNITVVGEAGPGHLIVYPSGGPAPATSYMNFDPGQGALANGGIVALSSQANDLAITSANGTHVIVDVFGYFQ